MRYFIFFVFSFLFSNEIQSNFKNEIGVFKNYKYIHSEQFEISSYPIYFFVIPNINVRYRYNNTKASDYLHEKIHSNLYSNHSFFIPTALLNAVKKEGMMGIVSPELDDFPFMIAIKNEIEIFKEKENYNFNFKIGMTYGYSAKKLDDPRHEIDLPIIYPRMKVFYTNSNYNINSFIGYNYKLNEKLTLFSNLGVIFYPNENHNFHVENKSFIIWNYSKKVKIKTGYKLVYGEYPFGNKVHLLPFNILPVPLFDITWSW